MTEVQEKTYHQEEAKRGPLVLEKLSDLEEAAALLGDFHDIRGMRVVNTTGEEVGHVDELYVDPKSQQVSMVGITFGGMLGFNAKHVLVPMDQLQIMDDESVRVMTTPEIVAAAPEFSMNEECADYMQYHDYWCQTGR